MPAVRDRRASQAAEEAEEEWLGKAGRASVGDGRARGSGESTRAGRADDKELGEGGAEEEEERREGSEPDLVMLPWPSGRRGCCGVGAPVSSRSSVTPRLLVLVGSEPVSVPSSELACRWPHSPVAAKMRCRSYSTSSSKGCGGASSTAVGQSFRLARGGASDGRGPPARGRAPGLIACPYDADRAAWWR